VEKQVFQKVSYRAVENSQRNTNVIAFKDTGTLIVSEEGLEFQGKKGKIKITNIQRVLYDRQRMDLGNSSVKIECQDGRSALLADGRWLGWKGMFGGTQDIYRAIAGFVYR